MTPGDLGRALKRARKAAGFPNARDFLAAVREQQGSAPSYSSYAQWESGEVTPRDESLAPVAAFHKERGTWSVPGGEQSLQERAVLAAERQAAAAERQAEAAEHQLMLAEAQLTLLARQLAALERIAGTVSGSEPDPRAVEETRQWALAALDAARPPRQVAQGGQ